MMNIRFRFEKLEVWQQARKLNQRVYRLARKLPKDELFGMTSQLRRAAVSVSSNMAEGSGRNSDKDFAHFLEQSYGSLMELASLLYLALDERYLSEPEVEAALDRPTPVEPLFQGLAHEVFFKAFAACILQDARQPQQLLPIEPGAMGSVGATRQ